MDIGPESLFWGSPDSVLKGPSSARWFQMTLRCVLAEACGSFPKPENGHVLGSPAPEALERFWVLAPLLSLQV